MKKITDKNGEVLFDAREALNTSLDFGAETRGGKRQNSGRKKKDETKTLSYRVPKEIANVVDDTVKPIITDIKQSWNAKTGTLSLEFPVKGNEDLIKTLKNESSLHNSK